MKDPVSEIRVDGTKAQYSRLTPGITTIPPSHMNILLNTHTRLQEVSLGLYRINK